MTLQIRRGLQIDLPSDPADGELLYTTNTKKLFIGIGGAPQELSGVNSAPNIDGGSPDSSYAGISPIDGGSA
jgi:hypothetical protein